MLSRISLLIIILLSSAADVYAEYGDKKIVRNISIVGDRRTKKSTIFKELTFSKGDAIYSEDLEKNRQQLMNMDLFSEVSVEEIGIELIGAIDVRITVNEKWSYLPLPIFSRSSDADTRAGFSYEDFNLWGQGHYLKLKWVKSWIDDFDEYVGENYSLQLSTHELTTNNIVLSTRFQKKEYLERTYLEGKEISRYRKNSSFYSLDGSRQIKNFYLGMSYTASRDNYGYMGGIVQDYENLDIKSASLYWGYNIINNLGHYTYEGFLFQMSIGRSNKQLGSDINSTRYDLNFKHFIHLGKRKNLAYRFKASKVKGGGNEEIYAHTGGSTAIRGYESGEFKGDRMFQANTEYRFPITENYWGGVLFIDGGYAWPGGDELSAKDLKWGAGLGFRLLVRQLVKGVGRIDFAYNFDRHETKGYMGVRHTF
ncbi:MAG: BamA/TamA family outer membrane protein [Deltaproteobacteria bacterium]|nr:BamA/TamA family outer membrane protein [Deltaproteobacteria bacterium]